MAASSRSIKILTWNIWFDKLQLSARTSAIASIIASRRPVVACLQEVTPAAFRILRAELSPFFFFSPYDETCSYSTLTLVDRGIESNPHFRRCDFETSDQGRFLQVAVLGCGIRVGNVHLESLNNHTIRIEQLETSKTFFNAHDGPSLLCGDFNFCGWANYDSRKPLPLENDDLARLLPDFIDAWPAANPGDKGYTFDSDANSMLAGRVKQRERFRFDRVLFKPAGRLRLESAVLLGTEPINAPASSSAPPASTFSTPPRDASEALFCSDHFGLLADFSF